MRRRSVFRGAVMERFWSVIPFALGGAGVLLLYQLLQRVRQRAHIQDAVVVITGASSGLGKECARVFHAAGARLILCGRDRTRLQQLVQELGEAADGKRKTYSPSTVTFDLSDTATVASAAEEILQCHGHVDILINNAGISYRGAVLTTHVDVHKEVMGINYFGPLALTQAILPSMVQRRSGHVVVISSVQGKIAVPFRSAYAASKHATQAFFDCLRAEVAELGVTVSVISPGYIRTNLSLNAVTADGSRYGGQDHGGGAGPAGGGRGRAEGRRRQEAGRPAGRAAAHPGRVHPHPVPRALLQAHGLPRPEGAQAERGLRARPRPFTLRPEGAARSPVVEVHVWDLEGWRLKTWCSHSKIHTTVKPLSKALNPTLLQGGLCPA
ncbi:dehydrogenase/reductase SDR family member 7B isoform X2 [Conger conger]|uniref:dehydrogenase/reductase SDR family member 7B isoform X2 n=1 Tax=Conger conger TaxID=82655 RepID=UPI002A5AC0F0|nr:dehydrogenase/reductase SDR family member 7B isoform X2 [Conger conger]